VGVTGGGKSSTSNTLAGKSYGANRSFGMSDSMVSVTQTASFRDYTLFNQDYRVIDTPGLADTHRTAEDVHAEITRMAGLAPFGVSAFVLVVPRGRFTDLQRAALEELVELFGAEVSQHSILAITSAIDTSSPDRSLMTRNDLLDEVHSLPRGNFLRAFVEAVQNRLVPVENHLEPHRTSSRLLLHQRVADVLQLNGGRTFDVAGLAAKKGAFVNPWLAALGQSLGQCSAVVDTTHRTLVITCPLALDSSALLPPAATKGA
jgi:hypothetical protein